MTRRVLVFVDALPAGHAERLRLGGLEWKPLVPGIGYSINIKAEMLAGMPPDRLGLLNEFQLRPRPTRVPWAAVLSPLDRIPYVAWFGRRVWTKITRHQLNNIPFKLRRYFVRSGVNAYEPAFPHPTVLTESSYMRVLDSAAPDQARRDTWVAESASAAVREGRFPLFASFSELDHDLHVHGFDSREVSDRLSFYDRFLKTLRDLGCEVLAFSDHGMCTVDQVIDVMSPLMAASRSAPFRFFVDSTMVRVWDVDGSRRTSVRELLEQRGLVVLDEEQREELGVTDRRFGDLIALAPECAVFSPNFYGRGVPRAMHGYAPWLPSQWGAIGMTSHPEGRESYGTADFLELARSFSSGGGDDGAE